MIDIKGWARSSLIDYPGRIAAVLFTNGCNLRCPMCHNGDLVCQTESLPSLDVDEIMAFLARRAGRLTGVVITGGEPTLHPRLPDFIAQVRQLGYAIKLDTNGTRPERVSALLDRGLVDDVAMDVKAPPDKYATLAGVRDFDPTTIAQSMALISAAPVRAEFRTTVVPGLLTADDIEAVARWIAQVCNRGGTRPEFRYVLQQFRGGRTLDPALSNATPYAVTVLHEMADRARQWLEDVRIRGV